MTGRSEQQKQEAVADVAIAWLLRLNAPEATEADWLALQAWLKAAPENRAAYDRVEGVSHELTSAAADLLRALDAPGPSLVPVAQPRRPLSPRRDAAHRNPWASRPLRPAAWRAAGGLAAAAAALVLFVAVQPEAPVPAQVYQTAKGENRLLALADGSRVHLNSGSRIAVRFDRKGRHVELTEGEAAFDVAHDTARPFLIAAGERDIRVVGTEFDVLRHEGRLRVTVRRGIVSVQSPTDVVQAEPILLKAGDELEHRSGARLWTVRRVDPDTAFAWRNGDLVYRDQRLDEVVSDLNRYFSTPLQVEGGAASLRFSGVLKIDSEDAVVRRLQAFLPLSADRGREGVTLRLSRTAG
jgi:transmembrane sensor